MRPRERDVRYFGICFGMQMAVIEAARNPAGIEDANSTEFGPSAEPVVGLMTEWLKGNALEKRQANGDMGGTMRLGAYPAVLDRGSKVSEIYGATEISERHRHRYEVNTTCKGRLEQHGMRFCGMSPDGVLPEIIEYAGFVWRCAHRTLATARWCGPVVYLTLSAPDPRYRSAVRRRAVSPRAQVAAVCAAPAVCFLC